MKRNSELTIEEKSGDERVASGASADSSFHSILMPGARDAPESGGMPDCFHDLQLDRIVGEISAGWADYDIVRYFHVPLRDPDAIVYRQEVMGDLEDAGVMQEIQAFSQQMRLMRKHLEQAQKRYYSYEKERWHLEAADVYCSAVRSLSEAVGALQLSSRGLRGWCKWLRQHVESASFKSLATEATDVKARLASIRYRLVIHGNSITVLRDDAGVDYSEVVEQTFEKFRRGEVRNYLSEFSDGPGLNHIDAQLLGRVALLFPEPFAALDAFCSGHANFTDTTVACFDREIQFYVAYLAHIARMRRMGLTFCYPQLLTRSKELRGRDAFDLALAGKLLAENKSVVLNDFDLHGEERIFVVSGPNNGGKTTFARMLGQLHYLGCLGCPIPGSEARVFVFDQLFTHFEREESIVNLRGKLQDELIRIRDILDRASSDSLLIMNEIFASTTLQDGLYLERQVIGRISRLDMLAVCVTFMTELASFDEKTVSVASTVDRQDPAVRTFKVERRAADGLAYALALAEKYRVTYARLAERIRP